MLLAALGLALVPQAAGRSGVEAWPGFRGDGSGHAGDVRLPLTWSDDENLLWSIELPGLGHSSPIGVGDALFVTSWSGYGEDPDDPGKPEDLERHLTRVRASTGEIVWKRSVGPAAREDPFEGRLAAHGYASNTSVTDGERVYVHYGKRGVLAYDLDGKKLWEAEVGAGSSEWNTGSAGSLTLFDGRLYVNAADESYALLALDARTGKELWRRESEALDVAFGAPVVARGGGDVVIAFALLEAVWGLDPATGASRWSVETKTNGALAPTCVVADEVLYSLGGQTGDRCHAIRLGGEGEVTGSHLVWASRFGAYVPSPIHLGDTLFWVDDGGMAHALDAASGELLYRERLEGTFYASPVEAGGRIYLPSRREGTFVLSAGRTFELLAVNVLESDGSRFDASPAVLGERLFLRSETHLYALGTPPDPGGEPRR